MIINFNEEDSKVLINAILDRTLSGGSTSGSTGGSAQTPPGLSSIMGTLSAIQHQIQTLRDDTMASFPEILSAVQGNSTLIAEATTELLSINSRVAELLSSSPSAAQLTELQGLVSQQGQSLTQIVDTAKQTAPLSPSPVEPTPVPAPDPSGTIPVVPPVEPAPAPVEPPATPDPVVVEPAPVDVGLPGGVAIDVPPVDAPPADATPAPVVATPVTPAPLF